MVCNQNFGCLGTGLPYAVGASVADSGKRPVLFTTSDSAFLYHIAELEVRFDKPDEGLGCQGMYLEKSEELVAAITKAFASGKPTVIHMPIHPVINHGGNQNLDTPNYDRFRTWYAEGQQ